MFQDSSTGPRPVCLILIEDFCPKFHWIWNSGSGGDFYFKLCRPICSVMGKSLWNFETILSPPVLFLLTFQSSTSFVDLGLSWHIVEPVSCSFVVTWLERDDLLPLLCVMFSCFSSLSHSMSWFRCGTWLYRFRIFAFFLTLAEGIIRNILWNYFYFIGIILNFHISDLEHFLGCTFMTQFVQSSSYIHINVLICFLPSHFFLNKTRLSHELNQY